MNRLLVSDLPDSLGGKLEYGLETALIGVLIVFAVLVLLMIVIKLFQLFFYTVPQRIAQKKAPPAPVRVPDPEPDPVAPSPWDGGEIPAVLAAAVAAYLAAETPDEPAGRYRIRSFRRLK